LIRCGRIHDSRICLGGLGWVDVCSGSSTARSGCATRRLAGEAVEGATGAGEVGEAFFFGAEFRGMGNEAAAGAAGGMLDVKHLVEKDVFDGEARDAGAVHAAVEEDLVRAGIVATELAAPAAVAPTDVRAREFSLEVPFV